VHSRTTHGNVQTGRIWILVHSTGALRKRQPRTQATARTRRRPSRRWWSTSIHYRGRVLMPQLRTSMPWPEEKGNGNMQNPCQAYNGAANQVDPLHRWMAAARRSSRNPFPNWRESPADSAMAFTARDRSLQPMAASGYLHHRVRHGALLGRHVPRWLDQC
jgi:hypothetical protein